MADANGYPKVGVKPWTALRLRAASAPSTRFTGELVAALLGMKTADSAVANVLRPMKNMGLLNDDGSLSPRGNKWRLDPSYAEACQEILDETYPADLAAFVTNGRADKGAVSNYFQHQGFGQSNARQMAATYAMIASKEPPDPAQATSATDKAQSPHKTAAAKKTNTSGATRAAPSTEPVVVPDVPRSDSREPRLHIDIQIHIPATASAEQIDQIFGSMAKHLYSK